MPGDRCLFYHRTGSGKKIKMEGINDLMKSAFISHNSKDKPFVRQLAGHLSKYGISCWIDESEIKFGES